jgi:predicted nucleic acid-binding protein
MKIADTSAWIEYYRKNGRKNYKTEMIHAIKNNICAVCGIIKIELLVHAKSKNEYDLLDSDLSGLHWLEINKGVINQASEIGYSLKRKGITIPSTDLIIASCTLANKAELIHLDKHFEEIKKHYPLKTIYFK